MPRALLIVDFQNDFTPGGALPVKCGDDVADPINAISDRFEFVVATRDWHPLDHGSLAERHRPDAATHPVARLEHGDLRSAFAQGVSRGEAREPRADDADALHL